MTPEAEVVGRDPGGPRGGRGAVYVAATAVVAVVAVLAVFALSGPDAESPPAGAPRQVELTMGTRTGVSTDDDHDRFTYATTARNFGDTVVEVTGVEVLPTDGLAVVFATVAPVAEFDLVLGETFSPARGAALVPAGGEVTLVVRVAVDCAASPEIEALRLHLRQGLYERTQVVPAPTAGADLGTVPARVCH